MQFVSFLNVISFSHYSVLYNDTCAFCSYHILFQKITHHYELMFVNNKQVYLQLHRVGFTYIAHVRISNTRQ